MNIENSHKIVFERPDLAELTEQYTVVDPHFHTHYSDGFNSVKAIVKRARELGIGIAVTDHNDIRGAVELHRHKNILSIPGIEITSCEGTHILVYFYDIKSLKTFYHTDIKSNMGHDIMSSTKLEMEAIIERARQFESIIVFPHPYSATFTGIHNSYFSEERLEQLFRMVDGVEVINAENLNKWNLRSSLLGFNLDIGLTGGSDGHRLAQMGRAVCYAGCRRNRRAFLNAIKNKQTKVVGKEIDLIRKVTSNGVKLRTNFKNCPDLVEKNLRYSCSVINSKSKVFRDNVKRSFNGRFRDKRKGSAAI
ncbi:MAG: PHP domain-containing protein [Desulfobacterales bacterium]|nr:PHP domain-containing protein [Desulfobacterales bacterium]